MTNAALSQSVLHSLITGKTAIFEIYPESRSILNGVDDDFSTPFFVFTKDLRNAIK